MHAQMMVVGLTLAATAASADPLKCSLTELKRH